jgi:hypothetical protein
MTDQPKGDPEHLAWAIDQRAEVQRTLLGLYEFVSRNPVEGIPTVPDQYILNHLIGAAFSLWRAVFLADTFRDHVTIHRDQKAFLEKVISDNAITFADDKNNRHWTVDYYLENAKFRIAQASTMSDHYNKTKTHADVMQFLRIKGTMGVELTRYEWESAHYALRVMLKVLDPSTKLEARKPEAPKPTALEQLFEKS